MRLRVRVCVSDVNRCRFKQDIGYGMMVKHQDHQEMDLHHNQKPCGCMLTRTVFQKFKQGVLSGIESRPRFHLDNASPQIITGETTVELKGTQTQPEFYTDAPANIRVAKCPRFMQPPKVKAEYISQETWCIPTESSS